MSTDLEENSVLKLSKQGLNRILIGFLNNESMVSLQKQKNYFRNGEKKILAIQRQSEIFGLI